MRSTLITAPVDSLEAALREVPCGAPGPRIIGAHVEGPFLAPDRMGTHTLSSRAATPIPRWWSDCSPPARCC